jgi:phosphatidate cytidylyltransferase
VRVLRLPESVEPHPPLFQWGRVLTAVVGVPVVVLLTIFASNSIFALVIGIVAAAAVEEFLGLATKRGIGRPGRWFLVLAASVAMSFSGGPGWVLGAVVFATLVLMATSIFYPSTEAALGRVGMGLSSIVYCPLMLGFIVLIPREQVLLLLAIIWIGDTAAYYCGRAVGRHLLAPTVSPKKTIEGALAGLIGSTVAGLVGGTLFLGEAWPNLVWISSLTAIAGQVGDLAESVLKRSAGVKDSSSIVPGHGGILDRLDSLFFAAPVFFWLLMS